MLQDLLREEDETERRLGKVRFVRRRVLIAGLPLGIGLAVAFYLRSGDRLGDLANPRVLASYLFIVSACIVGAYFEAIGAWHRRNHDR